MCVQEPCVYLLWPPSVVIGNTYFVGFFTHLCQLEMHRSMVFSKNDQICLQMDFYHLKIVPAGLESHCGSSITPVFPCCEKIGEFLEKQL